MLTRRHLMTAAATGAAALALPHRIAAAAPPVLGDDGLYHQDWFLDSFLEVGDDLAEAADAGKHFAIFWEQAGCPYCRKMHEINLARDDISNYLKENFTILQVDLRGAREITDFDGTTGGEREIARRWAVNFTPTIQFFPMDPAAVEGKSGREAEIARIQGYLSPFYFYHFFEWVRIGAHKDVGFQSYVNDKARAYADKGISPKDWVLE